MKIIGHTEYGYFLQASEAEIRLLSDGKAKSTGGSWHDPLRLAPIGTEFEVTKAIEHINELRSKAETAKRGAAYLIALGQHLEKDLPQMVHEPAKPEETATEAGGAP